MAIYDTGGERTWFYNADERFPFASTFKALACAALLNAGNEISTSTVTITKADVQSYAPVTKTMVGKRVSSAELCEITLRTSDNTAANKVLDVLGGPPAVTSFLRSLGDRITRLDRIEPELNEGRPGNPRDSTTPRAMADTIQKLILGNALEDRARIQLTEWLVGNEVGGPLLGRHSDGLEDCGQDRGWWFRNTGYYSRDVASGARPYRRRHLRHANGGVDGRSQ
nr:serine hydrolase [Sinorhizobium fredii]